jgi:hypothetical protein
LLSVSACDLRAGTITLAIGGPALAAAAISAVIGVGNAMAGVGCALGNAFGGGSSPAQRCPSDSNVYGPIRASEGLGAIGGALTVTGLGLIIAHAVEKRRLAALEDELEEEHTEWRRRMLERQFRRQREQATSWRLERLDLAPLPRGGGGVALALRF